MEETSEDLPNFSIAIDLLGPDPTSSKSKAELKKLASCAFRKFVEDQLQQIFRGTQRQFSEKYLFGRRFEI